MSDQDDKAKTTTEVVILPPELARAAKAPPCLVLISGSAQNAGRQWPLEKPTVSLGRLQNCDIRIEERGVSKEHAVFTLTGGKIYVTDLGATNKTMINALAIPPHEPQLLKNNDEVRTGPVVFKFLQGGVLRETAEKARMQAELENARQIQGSFLPSKPDVRYPSVHISGRFRPASEVGGDWWWHWLCEDKVFVVIADATGHGAGAALIASAVRYSVIGLEDDAAAGIEKVYTTLSTAVEKCSAGAVSMTAWLMEFDTKSRKLKFINASHEPPILFPPDSAKNPPKWTQLNLVAKGLSAPLGVEGGNFSVSETTVAPGSRLVLFTDGLIQNFSISGVTERALYMELIKAHADFLTEPTGFLDRIFAELKESTLPNSKADDVTVVVMDFFQS
jgi:serine phosphatase RsbU (regulator of sigma subunit)